MLPEHSRVSPKTAPYLNTAAVDTCFERWLEPFAQLRETRLRRSRLRPHTRTRPSPTDRPKSDRTRSRQPTPRPNLKRTRGDRDRFWQTRYDDFNYLQTCRVQATSSGIESKTSHVHIFSACSLEWKQAANQPGERLSPGSGPKRHRLKTFGPKSTGRDTGKGTLYTVGPTDFSAATIWQRGTSDVR